MESNYFNLIQLSPLGANLFRCLFILFGFLDLQQFSVDFVTCVAHEEDSISWSNASYLTILLFTAINTIRCKIKRGTIE